MIKKISTCLFFAFCFSSNVNATSWFNEQSALSTAHKQFIEGEPVDGFYTVIEVLQNTTANNIQTNIDKLLNSATTVDCGRDYSTISIPNWLASVSVQRMVVQSPGRVHHKLVVQFDSEKPIADISFVKWPEAEQLPNPTQRVMPTQRAEIKQYSFTSDTLNNRVKSGLYKLRIIADDEQKTSWESWVVLTTPKIEMQVSWLGKDKWKTTQTGLLKSNCPLPEMKVGIYDHQDTEYMLLWEHVYEEQFPQSLPNTNVLPGSYILSVSFNHKRFQGPISIQEIQAITKVINFDIETMQRAK